MTETRDETDYISPADFAAAGGTQAFAVVGDGATAFFPTDSFQASARFVHAISELDGVEGHRPDVDVRATGVTVRLVTKERWYGMSRRDVELARAITGVAAELGLAPDLGQVQSVHPIVIGARDPKAVMPFWAALMGYVPRPDSPDEDLVDPRDRGPGIWFETLDEPAAGEPGTGLGAEAAGAADPPRNRMHVAVWVPLDQAQARVDAAIAAGGRVIFDRAAPMWWTLVDPEGNEADVSTIAGRG